jgi:hypothetical protein
MKELIVKLRELSLQAEGWFVLLSHSRNMGYGLRMPVALHTIEPKRLGLRYAFIALGGLSGLADLGFSQTEGRFAVALVNGEGWLSKFGIASPMTAGSVGLTMATFVHAAKKKRSQLLIPSGIAHGFLALEDDSVMVYKSPTIHSPTHDAGIRWDSFGVDWGVPGPNVSERACGQPRLAFSPAQFELFQDEAPKTS